MHQSESPIEKVKGLIIFYKKDTFLDFLKISESCTKNPLFLTMYQNDPQVQSCTNMTPLAMHQNDTSLKEKSVYQNDSASCATRKKIGIVFLYEGV